MDNSCYNHAGVSGNEFINSVAAFHRNMTYWNGFIIPPPVLPEQLKFGEDYTKRQFLPPPPVGRIPANVCSKASGDWMEATGAPIPYFGSNEISPKPKVNVCYPPKDATHYQDWGYWSGGLVANKGRTYDAKAAQPHTFQNFAAESSPSMASKGKVCNFCRRNGDRKAFYTDHQLRDSEGKVECPILRKHCCEVCGATGDQAHTKSYCPVLKAWGKAPRKNAGSLKDTPRDSCGRIRKLSIASF